MGGCSSKPKTAEFEGALELQEDKPSTEAPRKSLEAENLGLKAISRDQELSASSIRTLLTEREQDDAGDMFAETHDKRTIAASSLLREERQVLEDDSQHVKQILAESIDNLQAEKGSLLNGLQNGLPEVSENLSAGGEDILELQKEPAFHVALELQGDVSTDTSGKGQGKGVLGLGCCEGVSKTEEQRIDGSHSHKGQDNLVSEGSKECGELCTETEGGACEEQRLDGSVCHKGHGNQFNEGSKECDELCKETDCGACEEQRLEGSGSHKGQDNQFGEGSKEYDGLCKETEGGACKEVSAASNTVLAQESEEDVLKDISTPRCEERIKCLASDEAVGNVTTNTCIIKDGPFPDTDQERSRVNASTDAVHPAITTNVRANSLQHAGDELDLVQEDQEVNGKNVKLQAEGHLTNGFNVKELTAGTLYTTHGDGELSSPKSSMNDPLSAHLSLESRSGGVQREMPYAAEGQAKAVPSCAPDKLTACPVLEKHSLANLSTKKPEAQLVHVMDSAEPSLTSAQDIPAPDIDDVLEKLASEFERQESLARASS